MRFVIYGAGAIGGVIGARLHQHGHQVALIARGAHLQAIRERGLTLRTPHETTTFEIPAFENPGEVDWKPGDVVLLCMKSHQALAALEELRAAAGEAIPVACCQNGVATERMALRRFTNVYGTVVMLPSTHLEPGHVQSDSTAMTGILDTGRFPTGRDGLAIDITAVLSASAFSAIPRDNIMDWKYAKLLVSVGNAIEAICGSGVRLAHVLKAARAEGEACYRAAGIPWIDPGTYRKRREGLIVVDTSKAIERFGNSSWQSLARGHRDIETDFLNGEVTAMGRLYGIPTPVNLVLQRLSTHFAHAGIEPGAISPEELSARIEAATGAAATA